MTREELSEHHLTQGLKELKRFNAKRKIKAVIKMVCDVPSGVSIQHD
jgi:hypothetical protein